MAFFFRSTVEIPKKISLLSCMTEKLHILPFKGVQGFTDPEMNNTDVAVSQSLVKNFLKHILKLKWMEAK